ncbi:comFC protein [Clostridium fallax]|uniref:Competence protein ComFC n=1 Tax=Clostridium fallax TaxID=1533 RepID=A0A1M4VDT1_9CLOT|nr:ComF family protein [Clostridium fallax]SHE67131.1 competence protein ComFC [Clostridium fallax]SQB05763.1 comFC protein [Clostridium fallax]
MLNYIGNCILEVIYPHGDRCIVCNKDLESTDDICSNCYSNIYFIKEKTYIKDFHMEVNVVTTYSTLIKNLILDFKYKNNFYAGEFLAKLISNKIIKEDINFDVITFVPSSKNSIKKRGFNQCEVLALNIGNITNNSVKTLILKNKEVSEQKTLTKEERKINLLNAFSFNSRYNIKNKSILLIDDIITTGSTLYFCKKILQKEGAKEIILLTIAKSSI